MNLLNKIRHKISHIIKSSDYYKWYIVRNERYKNNIIHLKQNYYFNKTKSNDSNIKKAICIFDGRIKQGGLADRLRGILSTYLICKDLNIEFKIIFSHPFNLTDYLIPNKINWICNDSLNYNLNEVNICYLDSVTGREYESKKQAKWMKKEFKRHFKEFHVFTNAFFSYNNNYSELFNDLFQLSPRLENTIKTHKEILGNNYISVSCRFLDLLGDFNETFGTNKLLKEEEKNNLTNKILNQIEILHTKHPTKKILINSDSITFIEKAKLLDYSYIIEGNITHIDNSSLSSYETHEKTFVDFFMIANASEIYLLKTSSMHNSGYPYAASLIYNKPFYKIEF